MAQRIVQPVPFFVVHESEYKCRSASMSTEKAYVDKISGNWYTFGMTRDDVISILQRKQGERSLREFAKELKCSAAYLSDLYRGNREPGPRIMRYLGLTRDRVTNTTYARTREIVKAK